MTPRSKIVCAAILFSTGGAAIKWCGFDGWQLAAFRAGIALTTILLLVPEARRGWSWRTALVGCAYAATTLLYVQANKHTTAASTIRTTANARPAGGRPPDGRGRAGGGGSAVGAPQR